MKIGRNSHEERDQLHGYRRRGFGTRLGDFWVADPEPGADPENDDWCPILSPQRNKEDA